MGAIFSKPKTPAAPKVPDPLPPAPERSATETASLAASQRSKFFRRGGRAGTLLTGGSGSEGGLSAIRFLGGAART